MQMKLTWDFCFRLQAFKFAFYYNKKASDDNYEMAWKSEMWKSHHYLIDGIFSP